MWVLAHIRSEKSKDFICVNYSSFFPTLPLLVTLFFFPWNPKIILGFLQNSSFFKQWCNLQVKSWVTIGTHPEVAIQPFAVNSQSRKQNNMLLTNWNIAGRFLHTSRTHAELTKSATWVKLYTWTLPLLHCIPINHLSSQCILDIVLNTHQLMALKGRLDPVLHIYRLSQVGGEWLIYTAAWVTI